MNYTEGKTFGGKYIYRGRIAICVIAVIAAGMPAVAVVRIIVAAVRLQDF